MSTGAFGRPPHDRDFQRQYARKPARCQRRTVSGLRILSASSALVRSERARQTAVDRCCRRPPASVICALYIELMSKDEDFSLQCRARPDESNHRAPDQSAEIVHWTTISRFAETVSQI